MREAPPPPSPSTRYVEIGGCNGAPRYSNPWGVSLFRHRLGPSAELGITRRQCLPPEELNEGERRHSAAACSPSPSEGPAPEGAGSGFARLVKASLRNVRWDREARLLSRSRVDVVSVSPNAAGRASEAPAPET